MTSLEYTWSPPNENINIALYNFTCTSSNDTVIVLALKATVFEICVDLFSSATAYTCSIAAMNSAGMGPSNTLSVTTEGKTINLYKQLILFHFIILQNTPSVFFHLSHWVLKMDLI